MASQTKTDPTAIGPSDQGATDRVLSATVGEVASAARAHFSEFIRSRVNPGAQERDRLASPLARGLFREAGEIGLMNYSLPAEIGGLGHDKLEWGVVIEQLAFMATDSGLTPLLDMNVGVAELVHSAGKAGQIEQYAVPMATGERLGMPAVYESRDPFEYRSIGRQSGSGWVLDGSKPFVAGALLADTFLVQVRDEASNDLLAFLVEREDPGVSVAPIATTGLRSMGFGTLTMSSVRLDEEDRLLWPGDALSFLNEYFQFRRVLTACGVVGAMEAVVDACISSLEDRRRAGRVVLDLPNVQKAAGEMQAAIEASRAVTYRALAELRDSERSTFSSIANLAKAFVAEQAIDVGKSVMNLHGGEGYMRVHPWERYMRDVLGLIGGQGAQELLLIQAGQSAIAERQHETLRLEALQRRLEHSADAWWVLVALAVMLKTGGLDGLQAGGAASEEGELATHAASEVLRGAGLVQMTQGGLVIDPEIDCLIDDPSGLERILSGAAQAVAAARSGDSGEAFHLLDDLASAAGSAPGETGELMLNALAVVAFSVALETGALDTLARSGGPQPNHAQGEGPPRGEKLFEVLADARIVDRFQEDYLVGDALGTVIEGGPLRTALAAEVRSTILQGNDALVRAGEGRAIAGWHHSDPELLGAQGESAAALSELLVLKYAPLLEGLEARLFAAGAAVLDVGVGSGQSSIEICRRLPEARVVGIEPAAAPLALARQNVTQSPFADRIDLRQQAVEDLELEAAFDLAWVPQVFIEPAILPTALARVFAALRPGGWAVLPVLSTPGEELRACVRCFKNILWGGGPITSDALEDLLADAGFDPVRPLPEVPGMEMRLVAGCRHA